MLRQCKSTRHPRRCFAERTRGCPITFASKSLTETESRYSNIEREMFGIMFGLERFQQYVYGRHVEVHTDHKPSESIYTNHLFAAPPRLARMLIRIQQYDVSIKCVPSSGVKLVDALSRVNPCFTGSIRGLDLSVHEVHMYLNASPTLIVEIRMGTSKDSTLHALCEIISLGWPENSAHCPTHSMPFWYFRDELSVEDGLIQKGQRIILPKSLHAAALEQIHYAHQCADKCKLRAKATVFSCGINHDINEIVKSCAPCQAHQFANTKRH